MLAFVVIVFFLNRKSISLYAYALHCGRARKYVGVPPCVLLLAVVQVWF